jgi:hypothetical protein
MLFSTSAVATFSLLHRIPPYRHLTTISHAQASNAASQ